MGARAGGRVGGWVGGWVGSSVGGQNEEGVAPRLHTPTRSPTQHIPTRARPLPPPLPPCTRSLHYVLWGDDGSRTPVDLARLDRYALKLGGSDAWTELGPGDALLAAPPPPGEGGAPQPPPPAPKRVPLSPGGGGAIGSGGGGSRGGVAPKQVRWAWRARRLPCASGTASACSRPFPACCRAHPLAAALPPNHPPTHSTPPKHTLSPSLTPPPPTSPLSLSTSTASTATPTAE